MVAKHTRRTSAWDDVSSEPCPTLTHDISTDVIIIGGGLAGIMTAYELATAGIRTVLLEKKKLGCDATLYTTAFISQVIDTSLVDQAAMFGRAETKRIWQSGGRAIERIEEIIRREKIDCNFKRCSSYIYANSETELEGLRQEQAVAKKFGFETRFKQTETQFTDLGYFEVKRQAKFHPLKFLYAVAEKAKGRGALMYENSEAVSIKGRAKICVTLKNGAVVSGQKVIIATYQPFTNPRPTVWKKGMYVSYVFEVEIPKGLFGEAIHWDAANPYHYFRIDKRDSKHDRMVIGGEDHREEIKISPAKNFKALEEHLRQIMRGRKYRIIRKWRGPILEPASGLAMIGETVKKNQYVATAFSGNGMTYSVIAAGIFRDLLLSKKNPNIAIYDPARHITLKQLYHKGKDYASEFVGGVVKNAVKY